MHHDRLRKCNDSSLPIWFTRKLKRLNRRELGDECDLNDSSDPDDLNMTIGPLIDEPIYCICRKPWNNEFMIGCDYCGEWYHGKCVKVSPRKAKKIDLYKCLECVRKGNDVCIKDKN